MPKARERMALHRYTERQMILSALVLTDGNVPEAARFLNREEAWLTQWLADRGYTQQNAYVVGEGEADG